MFQNVRNWLVAFLLFSESAHQIRQELVKIIEKVFSSLACVIFQGPTKDIETHRVKHKTTFFFGQVTKTMIFFI